MMKMSSCRQHRHPFVRPELVRVGGNGLVGQTFDSQKLGGFQERVQRVLKGRKNNIVETDTSEERK